MKETRKFKLRIAVKDSEISKDRRSMNIEKLNMKKQLHGRSYYKRFLRHLFSPRSRNNDDDLTNMVNMQSDGNTHKQDPTRLLPKTIVIFYCEGCQTYSHSSGSSWLKAPLDSPLLAEALLEKLRFYCCIFRLTLINSWFFKLDAHHISFALRLRYLAPNGVWDERICTVESQLAFKICRSCSPLVYETQLSSVVQLRQYAAAHNTSLRTLEVRVLSNPPAAFNIQKIKHTDHGMDFFLTNDRDAMALYFFLKSRAPIRHDEIHNDTTSCQSFISATVCPVCEDDLVQLPSKGTIPLGRLFTAYEHTGPLAICTGVNSTLFFIDPLTLQQYQYTANDYWSQPFEPLKTSRELVEYIVLDVKKISREKSYLLAEMRVAQVLDSGKSGKPVSVRSHLGHELKPGDHALGYDLSDVDVAVHCDNILPPPVVLIKKCCLATRPIHGVSSMKVSPENEELLKYLEKSEAELFNPPLNAGYPKNHIAEMSSEKPQTSGLGLEDLLADLSLRNEQ